jgi:cell division protein ZapA
VHDFLQQQRSGGFDMAAAKRRIGLMSARLDGVLAQQEKLF